MARTSDLTEYESHVLAIIAREQPTTAYKVRMILEGSPSAGLSSSAGSVYPMIRRLKAKGYITTAAVANDARKTELLLATNKGRAAIRQWIKTITPAQLLPDDPLRSRIAHAGALKPAERLAWLKNVKQGLEKKLAELDEYSRLWPEGMIVHSHGHAKMITRARLEWVTDLLKAEESGRL